MLVHEIDVLWAPTSLKTKVNGLSVVWPQNHWDGFSCFGLKTNGFEFPGLGIKTGSYGLVIWALKSLGQFLGWGLKTKRGMVCQLHHKTDRRMKMAWGTRRDQDWWRRNADGTRHIITEVVWIWSWRRMGWCDGLRQTLLSLFVVFIVLGPRGSLVFFVFCLVL
jgi:hypothetical protein